MYPIALVKSSDISNSRRDPEIVPPGQTKCLTHITRRRQANVSCYITRNHFGWVCSVVTRAMPPLNLCIPLPPLFQASHCRSVHCSGYHMHSQICQAGVQHSRQQSERGYPRSAKLVFNTPGCSQREGIPGDRYCPRGSSWGGRGLGRSLFNFIVHRICTPIIRKVIHINCKNFGKFINLFKELYKQPPTLTTQN